ncbi:glutathione peroxidase [Alteromonas pelagimontana]|uniref:Glutathione peroxidase n=1 Tax=Alteromonas pelagimontana TaxID=1858656 RepID=A0A6M4M881_9ALTE|nr:glutathione peroxidase [Alteromonas pelagimontana]QJR79402.1 glutathione peroxidase [Alteromonas pelagimontana]
MKKHLLALVITIVSASASANTCPDILKFMKRKLNSQETVNLCDEYQGKALLIVNTASYCGFTPQFEGLEAMYEEYKAKDFAILGFPSHDFNQEADDEGKTAELCELTYGVKFPMFEPISVKGDDVDPLYKMLAKATGEAPSWNFNKYLVSKEGQILKHYGSKVTPSDEGLREDVEAAIKQ